MIEPVLSICQSKGELFIYRYFWEQRYEALDRIETDMLEQRITIRVGQSFIRDILSITLSEGVKKWPC